jgi:DNA polymerase-3 subunit beta
MNVSCLQDELKRGVATVSRAISSKSLIPLLSNILLTTEDGQLRLSATNLELGITAWIAGEVSSHGAITLPAKLFGDIIGNLPNEQVTLALDEETQTVTITCGSFTNNMKGTAADDFPAVPVKDDRPPLVTLPTDTMRQAINQVAFAASDDETRQALTGVLVRINPNDSAGEPTLTLAAADGYRLATRMVPIEEGVSADVTDIQEMIVPARTFIELARVIGDAKGEVAIISTKEEQQILFSTEHATIASRLLDGKFPDYQRIIPSAYATQAVVETKDFIKAVKLASFFAVESSNFVKLTVEPGTDDEPGRVIINANAAEVGDNTGQLDAVVHGEGGQIAMNVNFLMEALNAVGTSRVKFEIQEPQNPGVFKPVGQDAYTHVIMPMTLRRRSVDAPLTLR